MMSFGDSHGGLLVSSGHPFFLLINRFLFEVGKILDDTSRPDHPDGLRPVDLGQEEDRSERLPGGLSFNSREMMIILF
jgi:hypothetical protein